MKIETIKTTADYRLLMDKIKTLMENDIRSDGETKILIELVTLVEEYENEHFPILSEGNTCQKTQMK